MMNLELQQLDDGSVFTYACFRPRVFARVLGLPSLVGNFLNWRLSSKVLLNQLLVLIEDESDAIEITHAELSRALWPETATETGKNKLARWLARFDEDQYLSGFLAIERRRGRYSENRATGEKEFFPSHYRLSGFYSLAERVGADCAERDILAISSLSLRQKKFRAVMGEILLELGASPILPGMRAEREAQKSKGRTKPQEGTTSVDFHRLPLAEQVDRVLTELFEISERAYRLVAECERYEESEQMVARVLKYQASHAAAALDAQRRRHVESAKPRTNARKAVEPEMPEKFRKSRLVGDVLAAAGLGGVK